MFKKYAKRLYCFSPPVMLATMIFEIGSALFVLLRYKMSPALRLVVALLVFLATFQLAEYMVCGGFGMSAISWARVGYVAITLLPPLGIHLGAKIAGKRARASVAVAYGTAAIFAVYFALAPHAFEGQQCLGNYVIFTLGHWVGTLYVAYYYSLLLVGLALFLRLAADLRKGHARRALQLLALGYVVFIVPTSTVNLFSPATLKGTASVMCGFAVFFAAVLVLGVMPHIDKIKHKPNNSK